MSVSPIPVAQAYLNELASRMEALLAINGEAIAQAAAVIEETARRDGLVYVFGTGHSHMLAEEVHYRAGGLALTVPVLAAPIMLHEGAVASTTLERTEGALEPILSRYPIGADDVLVIASNSGVNAMPLEAARLGKDRGATIVAITSQAYSAEVANGRQRLADIADIVLDNGAPAGDAVVPVSGSTLKVGPISTSIGAALLNAVLAEVAARLQSSGAQAPIYLSANMPDAARNNADLVQRYKPRNPHL